MASRGRFLSCVRDVCGVSGSLSVLCTRCLWRLGVVSCLVYEMSVASRGRFLSCVRDVCGVSGSLSEDADGRGLFFSFAK